MKTSRALGLVAALTTMTIAPHVFFDPINFPKLMVLGIGLFIVCIFLFFGRNDNLVPNSFSPSKSPGILTLTNLVLVLLIMVIFLSVIGNEYQRDTQFLGTWGRNTGVMLWLSLITVFYLSLLTLREIGDFQIIERLFLRCSFLVYSYALLQKAELDPVSWSSRDPTSFLGNINFVSAFLGIAATIMISMVLFRNLPVYTNIFYLFVCGLYIHYMSFTNSLQGLACFAIGTALLIAVKLFNQLKLMSLITLFSFSTLSLFCISLGVFGIGPLGRLLQQETMSFRLDYWSAGLAMIKANYLFGIGLDNYGNYYREFRSNEAATSTGPERVTNTAHNIFIDFGAGTGLLGGLLLFALFVLVIFMGLRVILQIQSQGKSKPKYGGGVKSEEFKEKVWAEFLYSYFAATVSYFVFMVVSINQIGVSVWGFIFFGALLRLILVFNRNFAHVTNPKLARFNFNRQISIFLLTLLVPIFVLKVAPAVKVEFLFLRALESNDVSTLFQLSRGSLNIPTYSEVSIEQAIKNGALSQDMLIQKGKELLDEDPRNFYALSLLVNLQPDEVTRLKYAKQLVELDPQNPIIRQGFKESG